MRFLFLNVFFSQGNPNEFPNHIFFFVFQIQLLRPRQRGSKTFERCTAFYKLLCSQIYSRRRSTVSPDNPLPQDEIQISNILSSQWDASTITSAGLTGTVEWFDHSIKFPAVPPSSSFEREIQSGTTAFTHDRLQLNDADGTRGRIIKVVDDLAGDSIKTNDVL